MKATEVRYHMARKTQVIQRIFKLTRIHASVIDQDYLNSLKFNEKSAPFGENSSVVVMS